MSVICWSTDSDGLLVAAQDQADAALAREHAECEAKVQAVESRLKAVEEQNKLLHTQVAASAESAEAQPGGLTIPEGCRASNADQSKFRKCALSIEDAKAARVLLTLGLHLHYSRLGALLCAFKTAHKSLYVCMQAAALAVRHPRSFCTCASKMRCCRRSCS